MRTDVRPPILRYLVAVAAVLLAFGLRASLAPTLGHAVPYLFFYPAVLVAAWFGGVGPGLVATALGWALAAVAFVDADTAYPPLAFRGPVPVIAFVGVGLIVSALAETLHAADRRARRVAADAAAAHARATNILESVTDAFFAVDRDWRFTYLNRRCEAHYGVARDTLVGRSLWDVPPGAAGAVFRDRYEQVVRDGRPAHFEGLVAGPGRWLEVHAYPSPDGLSVYFRDVTDRRQAEARLQASERQLHDILDNAPVVVLLKDLAGRYLFVNRQFERLFDVGRDRVVGRSGYDMYPSAVADELAANDRAVLAAGVPREIEERVPRPDGTAHTFLSVKFPLRDAAGVPYALCGIATDITARKRTETALAASEAVKAAILRAALDCVVTVDHHGRVVEWNPAAERTFGYPRDQVLGRAMADLIVQPRHRAAYQAGLVGPGGGGGGGGHDDETGAAGGYGALEGRRLEMSAVRADGAEFPAELAITRIEPPGGGPPLFTGYLRDITDRRRAEAERERLLAAEQAARREAERSARAAEQSAREAERSTRAAEAASRAKDQFLAVLSHELRTPLTPVLATVAHLEGHPGLPADVRDDLGTIRRNVQMEARLIDDLLDLTRIARGKIELHHEVTDAHAVVRDAATVARAAAEDRGVAVDVRLEAGRPDVWADPARLQQVVWNLLSNAVKFTPRGGRVTVRTADAGGGGAGGRFRLEVADTGIGIDPEAMTRIFAAFEQAEQTVTRRFGGLGLGLAISKALVEMQGGTLSAASDGPGRGATFRVELATVAAGSAAARPRPVPAGPPAPGPADRDRPVRLLLVEDHADTLRIMGRLLRAAGYEVTAAECVEEAVEHLDAGGFDVLVSDIGLPDGSGTDVMRRAAARGVRGVALSGFGTAEDVARSRAAGFAEHLTKPVDVARLEAAVRRLVADQDAGELAVGQQLAG